MKIILKKGLSTQRPTTAMSGELLFDTDTRILWVGTGEDSPLKELTTIVEGPNGGLYHETPAGYVPLCIRYYS